jgi:hypothetical protein
MGHAFGKPNLLADNEVTIPIGTYGKAWKYVSFRQPISCRATKKINGSSVAIKKQ